MKMKVILRPYWSFATMGFSEMNLLQYIVSHPGTLKEPARQYAEERGLT